MLQEIRLKCQNPKSFFIRYVKTVRVKKQCLRCGNTKLQSLKNCWKCPKCRTELQKFKKRISSKTNIKCPVCKQTTFVRYHGSIKFRCNQCDRDFRDPYRQKTLPYRGICGICRSTHIIMGASNRYRCRDCGKYRILPYEISEKIIRG